MECFRSVKGTKKLKVHFNSFRDVFYDDESLFKNNKRQWYKDEDYEKFKIQVLLKTHCIMHVLKISKQDAFRYALTN